ncbi:DNRLRE domain-containing protein [Chloroflexota bacterium]
MKMVKAKVIPRAVTLLILVSILAMAFGVVSVATMTGQASAQAEIPHDATITSATLSIYCNHDAYPGNQPVNVHRITAPWDEYTVTWNSFAGSYDPAVAGTFMSVGQFIGWCDVDVTALVQGWVDGTYSNYGLLLEQIGYSWTRYFSSEYEVIDLRPKLTIVYETGNPPVSTTIVIQRPGVEQDGVADAYIWEPDPDINNGNNPYLYAGLILGGEKQSLLRFDFEPTPPSGPGTGTPGYWKTHPEAWPVGSIEIGGVTYTRDEAVAIMWDDKNKDKTTTMFAALVCTKLNVLIGNSYCCVDDTIADADQWMADYGPVGSGVRGGGPASPWRTGEPLYETLDDYNNGLLCAPHRD